MDVSILIVEDEPAIADALVYVLKTEGFTPLHAATLRAAKEILSTKSVALIILDVGLPDGTGFDFCKEIRASAHAGSELPILFLTSRSNEMDKIIGLEIGGDDYVTKPFSPREISARVKVILKRSKVHPEVQKKSSSPSLAPESIFRIDDEKKRIYLKNIPLELGRYEYGILKILIEARGRVYSRVQLMDLVWTDPEMSEDRTVDAHIKLIRQKLREVAPDEELIITHRGLGYSAKENV